MNEKTKKDSFDSISSAPKRPQKLGSVQTIVRNEDMFKTNKTAQYEEITLSDDDDAAETSTKQVKCPTCPRDMTLWTASRRDIHTKVCKQHDDEKKGKTKRKLTETIEQDDKVRFIEPKPPKEPVKSWEVSKNNVKFARIAADDEENRRRKRPRSFAVVELAPKKCQCEVVTTLHSRFMEEFHFKSLQNKADKEQGLSEHSFQMSRLIEKLNRYEQLSADMQKVSDDTTDPSPSQITIKCTDGEVKCQKLTMKHRTTLLKAHSSGDIQWELPRETVRSWLTYVYTAKMEWSEDQVEDVRELAVKFGPVGLENAMKVSKKRESPVPPATTDPVALTALTVPEVTVISEEPAQVQEADPEEPGPEPERNIYTSDDPLIGFGNAVEETENDDDILMMDDIPAPSSTASTPQKSLRNSTMDSFDEWSNQDLHNRSKSSPVISGSSVTPIRSIQKPVFGSHVKILKTNDVTPMPEFDKMDEAELKERMKEIGMRPKGKKAMIQMLKKAYTTLHPEVCTGTPTIRPLIRPEIEAPEKGKKLRKTLSERLASPKKLAKVREAEERNDEEEEVHEADKTLNLSNDEREVGRICGDDVVGEEDEEETGPSTGKKDLDGLRTSFLSWLRNPQNIVLYEHILSLNPVSIEEMLIRLEKADGPLGRIGKAKLVRLLEMLKITYQLPQKGGPRKVGGGFKRRL